MKCQSCSKSLAEGQNYCGACGTQTSLMSSENHHQESGIIDVSGSKSYNNLIAIFVVIFIVIAGFFAQRELNTRTDNDTALSQFESGKSREAIELLEQASQSAVAEETKLITLVNLANIYASDSEYEKALETYKEALPYAKAGTSDFFLVSGEVALYEGRFEEAKENYLKAYELAPNDFQINNALNLFYLDLDDIYPRLVDYPEALRHAKIALESSEDLVKNTARQNLGIAYFFNDDYEQAITYLSYSSIEDEPYVAYWLGLAHMANENSEQAAYYLNFAVDRGVPGAQDLLEYMLEVESGVIQE